MADQNIPDLLIVQNKILGRIAVALETLVERNCPAMERIACILEVAPPVVPPAGPLKPPGRKP